jgi:hypothetical protein
MVVQSGTIEVRATVDGVSLTAGVHVSVVPCPTGDSLLDQPNIRKDFVDMMSRSNPDSAPGSGMSATNLHGNKREEALWIYKKSDGSYFTI